VFVRLCSSGLCDSCVYISTVSMGRDIYIYIYIYLHLYIPLTKLDAQLAANSVSRLTNVLLRPFEWFARGFCVNFPCKCNANLKLSKPHEILKGKLVYFLPFVIAQQSGNFQLPSLTVKTKVIKKHEQPAKF